MIGNSHQCQLFLFSLVITAPSTFNVPFEGSSNPRTISIRVVLPEPVVPTIPRDFPKDANNRINIRTQMNGGKK